MLSTACPKEITRHIVRRDRAHAEDRAMRLAYRQAEDRDNSIVGFWKCRATGVRFGGWLGPREHHHLAPRSTAEKAVKHTRQNIVCLSAVVHAFIKAGKLAIVGTNAAKPLTFQWTDLATVRERSGITLRDERRRRA